MSTPATEEAGEQAAMRSPEPVVDRIVEQVQEHGYFLVHVDPQPMQQIIDLRWAAQVAGRRIDRQVRAYTSRPGAQRPGKVTIIVAPLEFRCPSEMRLRDRVWTMIEELLSPREPDHATRAVVMGGGS